MAGVDSIARIGKVDIRRYRLSTATIIRLLTGAPSLLFSRSSVPFRDGNYGRTNASERIKFIISANARGSLSQFRREKATSEEREKGKATDAREKRTIGRPRRRLG